MKADILKLRILNPDPKFSIFQKKLKYSAKGARGGGQNSKKYEEPDKN